MPQVLAALHSYKIYIFKIAMMEAKEQAKEIAPGLIHHGETATIAEKSYRMKDKDLITGERLKRRNKALSWRRSQLLTPNETPANNYKDQNQLILLGLYLSTND
jgi:hypothetical protein